MSLITCVQLLAIYQRFAHRYPCFVYIYRSRIRQADHVRSSSYCLNIGAFNTCHCRYRGKLTCLFDYKEKSRYEVSAYTMGAFLSNVRSIGSLCIKGAGESLLRVDLQALLVCDPSDLGSLTHCGSSPRNAPYMINVVH